jgi:hypothetical protein
LYYCIETDLIIRFVFFCPFKKVKLRYRDRFKIIAKFKAKGNTKNLPKCWFPISTELLGGFLFILNGLVFCDLGQPNSDKNSFRFRVGELELFYCSSFRTVVNNAFSGKLVTRFGATVF